MLRAPRAACFSPFPPGAERGLCKARTGCHWAHGVGPWHPGPPGPFPARLAHLPPVGSAPHTQLEGLCMRECRGCHLWFAFLWVQLPPLHVWVCPADSAPASTPGAGQPACWSRSAGGPGLGPSCSSLHLARFVWQTGRCLRDRGQSTGRASRLGEGQGTGWLCHQAPLDSQASGKCQLEVRPPQPGERLCQHAFPAKQTTVWLINL